MAVLFVIYALNMLDRQIINILAEPMKRDLGITDTQIGLLNGLAFAVFYTLLGIPIARITDRPRVNRSRLLAVALTLWSGMTALCGLAANFGQLLVMRTLVGVGEASCVPASQAIVADLVGRERRATFMGILSAGIPVGRLAGLIVGGVAAQFYGWRVAFAFVGLPGILVAALAWFTVPDPRRPHLAPRAAAGLREALAALVPIRSYWFANLGAAFVSFVAYGQGTFTASFLIRLHHLPVGKVGLLLGLTSGLAGMIGSLAGGRLADRLSVRRPVAYMMVPAVATLVGLAVFPFAVFAGPLWVVLTLLALNALLTSMWLGPVFATLQLLSPPTVRATAVAIHMLIVNAIGLGFGPMLFGWLSDRFAAGFSFAGFTVAAAGPAAGLRDALAIGTATGLLSVGFFLLAARRIAGDIEEAKQDR